jgi:PKHD-type hydroxylase|tara:strand:- start:126 stop:767 length:642 start_codon:yes stop_codon:yes gene_type:complete
MNISSYWYFKSALTPKFCDDIINYGLSKKLIRAETGNQQLLDKPKLNKKQIKDLKKIRDSEIVWLDEPWIYREIHPYIHTANKNAGWNFEWDFSEPCQFTKYKNNQFYDWHVDSYEKPFDNKDIKYRYGKIRKLSVTCQLTDGSEYKGGELEFDFRDYNPNKRDESKHLIQAKEVLPKGSIIVFPSNSWHRVKPITKGTRYSLVLWNLGYPFK